MVPKIPGVFVLLIIQYYYSIFNDSIQFVSNYKNSVNKIKLQQISKILMMFCAPVPGTSVASSPLFHLCNFSKHSLFFIPALSRAEHPGPQPKGRQRKGFTLGNTLPLVLLMVKCLPESLLRALRSLRLLLTHHSSGKSHPLTVAYKAKYK